MQKYENQTCIYISSFPSLLMLQLALKNVKIYIFKSGLGRSLLYNNYLKNEEGLKNEDDLKIDDDLQDILKN